MMKKKLLWTLFGATLIAGVAFAATLPSLTNLANVSTDDIFYVVDNPGGAAQDRKVTLANLTTSMHAGNISIGGDLDVTGQILAADGASAAPSYSFSSDTDYGFFKTGD